MKLLRNPARWTAGGFARAEHHHLNTGDVDVPPPSPHDDGKTRDRLRAREMLRASGGVATLVGAGSGGVW